MDDGLIEALDRWADGMRATCIYGCAGSELTAVPCMEPDTSPAERACECVRRASSPFRAMPWLG